MPFRWTVNRASIAALAFMAAAPAALAQPPGIEVISQRKGEFATALAAQAALCSARTDTSHMAFRGCIDWHSAVHGVWALIAYERMTGDRRHAALVSRLLAPNKVEAERVFLKQSPRFEMPYGRAWFLRLAMDHRRLTGNEQLEPMAAEVAQSLRGHFRAAGIEPHSTSYASASWALLNLLDYLRSRNADTSEIEGWVRSKFAAGDRRCPSESERGHFMAVCTNRAALVARIMSRDDYAVWLDGYVRANGLPAPITAVQSHSYGLNFSRAWGLSDMHAKSGRADVAEAYAAHFKKGYSPEANWRGDYLSVGHWVAQFGMFALQPLFHADERRP